MIPFSFIIPVLNEAVGINGVVDTLYQQFPEETFEVIVVDGDPDGSTICVIQRPEIITLTSDRGRGRQMNVGVQAATGDTLIFLHADTKLPPDALQHVRTILSDGRYVAGAFTLYFDSQRWGMKLVNITASWRYRLTRYPYGDQAIFMFRTYFDQIGGYAEIPIMEDLDLMRRIKKRGDKICISKARVLTSARRWETEGILYSTLRTWTLASLFCLGVPADRLINHYRHHQHRPHSASKDIHAATR
jgi:rSAM/selenodomain-associated transferase 2